MGAAALSQHKPGDDTASSAPRESSAGDTPVTAERAHPANEQVVPAPSDTSASSAGIRQGAAELDSDDTGQNPDDGATGGITAARKSSLKRVLSKKLPPRPDTPGGSTTPGETLRRLSKLNPATHVHKEHMRKYLSGFRRFQKRFFADNTTLFTSLQHGQAPKTLLIGCCDSRCDPALITDCDPGDIFVIRNVANLVPPYSGAESGALHGTSAAMEFAVKALKVTSIIVLGHTQCGGIGALLQGEVKGFEFIESWMHIAQKAKEMTLKDFGDKDISVQRRACEHASILTSLQNLTTYPWISERLASGEININGWYFDFMNGDLLAFHPEEDAFVPLMEVDFVEEENEESIALSESVNAAVDKVGSREAEA
ncbi:hypothetical protein HDU86_004590 [Geranomyces michiganensis]|nr:hypothetical protein HDU86_004590 [Geranomyces michiganensis]